MPSILEVCLSRIREKLSPIEGKMLAVVEAKSILCAHPRAHADTKSSWLRRAAVFFRLTPAQAKKIYYEEVKTIDADRLDFMRARLAELKEQADGNQARLNDLIYLRNELRSGGSRALAGCGDQGPADGAGVEAGRGEGVREDRPAPAAVRQAE